MNKKEILQSVIKTLTRQAEIAEQGLKTTEQAAIDAPGAMQSHSDTTKFQMSRQAEVLRRSIAETREGITILSGLLNASPVITKCALFSIVEVENIDDHSKMKYFLLPAGGGQVHFSGEEKVTILSMGAPLAKTLSGANCGDKIEIIIRGSTKRLRITSIL